MLEPLVGELSRIEGKCYTFGLDRFSHLMTKKQISQNTGDSGRVNLSGPELEKFKADVGESIKVDVAESKEIAHAIVKNADQDEFVIVSKPDHAEVVDE